VALLVDADNLLVPGNHASFDRGHAARFRQDAAVSDFLLAKTGAENAAGFIIAQFPGGVLSANNTERFNVCGETSEVGSDVSRSAQTVGLRSEVHNGDRGFGRETVGRAPKVAVQHQVAENSDVNLAETRQQALKARNKAGVVGVHQSFGGQAGFFGQHDGNVIAYGVDSFAAAAFQT
jgi:3',5'-cyclic AMP phosphodiesterase CpdA